VQIGRGPGSGTSPRTEGRDHRQDCTLGQNTNVGNDVVIGSNVKIQNNVSIYTGTVIEDDVFLGPSCVLTNVTTTLAGPPAGVVRADAASARLQHRCKRHCRVRNSYRALRVRGAGSVVVKDVPDYALMLGVPARQAGWMSRHGHRLSFDKEGVAICAESDTGTGWRAVPCAAWTSTRSLPFPPTFPWGNGRTKNSRRSEPNEGSFRRRSPPPVREGCGGEPHAAPAA